MKVEIEVEPVSPRDKIIFMSHYNVSHPPASKVLSNFLATMLGIPWDNQVLLTTSHLA